MAATAGYSTENQASVKGKTYVITGITALAEFVDDTYTFEADGTLTSLTGAGTFQEVDLGMVSFWYGSITDTNQPSFQLDLVGLQLSTFLVSRGIDSNQLVYFLSGHELPTGPVTFDLPSPFATLAAGLCPRLQFAGHGCCVRIRKRRTMSNPVGDGVSER